MPCTARAFWTRRARTRRSLTTDLGPADRRKMDEYLTGIREVEMRIAAAEKDPMTPPSEKPSGIPFEYAEYVKLMFNLQVIAFQSDLTRVSTMMLGREGSVRTYPEIGVPDPHHPLTHHRGHPDFIEKVTKINCFHVELFAWFVERLKATPDGDGYAAGSLGDSVRRRAERWQCSFECRPAAAARRSRRRDPRRTACRVRSRRRRWPICLSTC